jgi:uncharacterized RDD family membrane protein YckC
MTSLDENLTIETPENIVFAYRVAGIGSRFLAAIIDSFIIIILEIVLAIALSISLDLTLDFLFNSSSDGQSWKIAVISLSMFVVFWGYYIFFETFWNGQSPGKRRTKLRVIRSDGTPITLTESLIRNIVRLVDFLPFNYAVGVVTMLLNSQSRRLGDLAAGTLVIHDTQGKMNPDESVLVTQSHYLESIKTNVRPEIKDFGPLPIEDLSQEDIDLATSFLVRCMDKQISTELDKKIVEILYKRMNVPLSYVNSRDPYMMIRNIVGFIHYQDTRREMDRDE